jgi:copper resistance protein B
MAGETARALALLSALAPGAASAQAFTLWGVQIEQLETRFGEDEEVLAWDGDAFVGTDELKLVFRSKAELELDSGDFETLEHQLRLQRPISDFFDAVLGVRLDTPDGGPDRVHGVIGVKGLAQQWFEIDADLYLSDHPSFRVEGEYEALITNRVILAPSVEVELPLNDDDALGRGAFGPKVEVGARLSYDLIDRAVAPYVGIHYERVFGETASIARRDGEDRDALFFVVGARLMF